MLYTLRFFSSKCNLFHNANLFGSCIIHILYTECAKIEKNNSGAKRLKGQVLLDGTSNAKSVRHISPAYWPGIKPCSFSSLTTQ